jgi:hypothetical protein
LKLSITRWTRRSLLSSTLALGIVLFASCVSAKPPSDDTPAELVETPEPVANFRMPPAAAALEPALPLPSAPAVSVKEAIAAADSADPNDIRVASPPVSDNPQPAGAMDEPPAPQKEAEAEPKPSPKPASPAAPVSKTPAPAQSPASGARAPAAAAAPAPTAPAPAATAPAPAAVPPAAAPRAEAASPAPNAAAPGAAFSLPSAPGSSARSVEAAAAPVAEIRVDAVRGERFELRFKGSGWTYLGDEESKDGMRYETRRFEGNEAVFSLRPEKSDDFLLRFQRQDPVSGDRQTSFVRVNVREPGTKGADLIGTDPAQASAGAAEAAPTGSAPMAASAQPVSPALSGTTAAAATPAAPAGAAGAVAGSATSGGISPTASESGVPAASPLTVAPANEALLAISEPAALLSFARAELDAKRVRSALDALDRYIELFKRGSDELFYLYGLAYEQDTAFRDIKLSYANYKRVRDEYPRSARWKASAERVAYMERHYYGLK